MQEPLPLCDGLKEATQQAHSSVDRSLTVRAFLRGCFTAGTYLQMVVDLLEVYEMMETCLLSGSLSRDPVRTCFDPAVTNRSPRLREDRDAIVHYHGGELPAPSRASRNYVQHLSQLAEGNERVGMIGHFYARYLGDLHGGQILGRIVTRALRLPAETGVSFYAFGPKEQLAEVRAGFRARLDQAGKALGPGDREIVTREALASFNLSYQILASSNGSFLRTFVRLLTPRFGQN